MKNNSRNGTSGKKKITILIEIAILIVLVALTVVVIKGDEIFKSEEPTMYIPTQGVSENMSVVGSDYTFSQNGDYIYDFGGVTNSVTNSAGSVNVPETNNQNQATNTLADPSGWSKSQIIAQAKDSVNKTKRYTGNLSVNHSENFTANVTECSAGGIVRSVVDLMIGWVVKPVEETLVYNNGFAVNSEGETVPVILPKNGDFTLTESGVESATIKRVGNEYHIKINIVEESVGMYNVPKHNAASIGYLNVSDFDLSLMEIDSADIVYKGSSIELKINENGYVTYAEYKIPVHIDGAAHKGSISGSASFEGEQSEIWIFNY